MTLLETAVDTAIQWKDKLQDAIITVANRWKQTARVAHARIHPVYMVIEVEGKKIIFNPNEASRMFKAGEHQFSLLNTNEGDEEQMKEGGIAEAARDGECLIMDEINAPQPSTSIELMDCDTGEDESDSHDQSTHLDRSL